MITWSVPSSLHGHVAEYDLSETLGYNYVLRIHKTKGGQFTFGGVSQPIQVWGMADYSFRLNEVKNTLAEAKEYGELYLRQRFGHRVDDEEQRMTESQWVVQLHEWYQVCGRSHTRKVEHDTILPSFAFRDLDSAKSWLMQNQPDLPEDDRRLHYQANCKNIRKYYTHSKTGFTIWSY